MTTRWVLDKDRKPRPAASVMEWTRWLQRASNAVVGDDVTDEGVTVHTRFIGVELPETATASREAQVLDARGPLPLDAEKRLLFETLILGGEHDHQVERYATWEEAVAGHGRWLATINARVRRERAITLREEEP